MPIDPEVAALLDDYIGLYARDTLDRWRALFLPAFAAVSTNDDGSITTRTLDEFLERQPSLFATGKPVSEVLEDVRSERRGPLAWVGADFVWTDGEITRRGRLMLLLISERGRLRIHSLTFTYHG